MITIPTQAGICAISSGVDDGNMAFLYGAKEAVIAARTALMRAGGSDEAHGVAMRVEHGVRIVDVTSAEKGVGMIEPEAAIPCDALVTQEPGLALFLLTADCIPLIFWDEQHNVLALAHAGWKGTAEHLAAKLLLHMQERYGTNARELYVYAGPCISADSYVVASPAQLHDERWKPFIRRADGDTYHVDLFGYTTILLMQHGVQESRIQRPVADTAKDARFFSHYRSARTGEGEGRIATIARIV